MTLGALSSYFFFQLLVPLLFTVAVASFAWGACLYFLNESIDEELAEKGKAVMLYGFLVLGSAGAVFALLSLMRP